MKAMIFAAGLGTRLRPLTDSRPKAMVEVNGKMMIDRVIDRLRAAGVDRIVVNVHHHAEMLKERLKGEADIAISDETDLLLDTGGGVTAAIALLNVEPDEPIILYNADILTDINLSDMVEHHRDAKADVTLLVDNTRQSSRKLLFNDDMTMAGWINESDGTVKPVGLNTSGTRRAAFGGIHIVSPRIFPTLQRYADNVGAVFSIMPFYIDNCYSMRIVGYQPATPYRWFDIGSIEKLNLAIKNFKE